MSRIQTRHSSRPDDDGRSPTRRTLRKKQSPARSPDVQEKNASLSNARQVKVTVTRLKMPEVANSSRESLSTEVDTESLSNGSTASSQSSLRNLRPRRSIRITSDVSVKPAQEFRRPTPRSANKFASPSSYQSNVNDEDDEVEDLPKKESVKRRADLDSSRPQEWAGSFGALLLTLSMPICMSLLQVACMGEHCGLGNFRVPSFHEWQLFFDKNAFALYAGYLSYLAIMSLLPIGKVVAGVQSKNGTLHYRINGLWTLILAASIFGGCVYQGYDIHEYLIKNSLQLTLAGLVYGLILSVVLYIKASWVSTSNLNVYGSTNSFIYNFWQGREINPRIGRVDVKQVLFESTVIATNLINLASSVKIFKEAESLQWNNLGNLNLAALAVISLQTIFFVDNLIFEARFLSSFEITYEGMGYMLSTGYLIYPFISTLSTRYLLVHKVQLSLYEMIFWPIVFFIGYYLYRASNNQKDEYRKNPFSPSVSHLETIPTPAGKRLLVSGFWGYVRRPNYLGDILMHFAWAFLGFAPDIMPYVLAIFTTLLLVHRAIRDEARCEKRYRFAWKQYCERVKYIILPPVF